jgi:hypothetical protein
MKWVPLTRYLGVELHDHRCEEALDKLLSSVPHRVSRFSEITFVEFLQGGARG